MAEQKLATLQYEMKTILDMGKKLLDMCILAESSDDREKMENCLIRVGDFLSKIKQFENKTNAISNLALKENISLSADYYELEETFDNVSYSIRTKERNLERLFKKKISTGVDQISSAPPSGISSHIKLPVIKLPTFSGDITLYQSFIELFHSLIHHNKDLTDVEKFQYLTLSLEGEPLSLVKCLKITTANYPIALDTLNKRYLNIRLVANNYLQIINRLNPISERSSQSLKKVIDQFKENWAAFSALLTETDQLNLLAVNMLLQKLDIHTREQFELSIVENVQLVPSVEMLINFVHKQTLALDNLGLDSHSKLTKFVKKDQRSKGKQSAVSLVVNSSLVCPVCNASHDILKCDVFLKKSPYERFKVIKLKNHCLNCLSARHLVKACDSPGVCSKCNRKHHSLLHYAKIVEITSNPNLIDIQAVPTQDISKNVLIDRPSVSTDPSVFTGMVTSETTILLATAIVNILDISGSPVPVRVLFDCGSQVNFISETCVQRLGIPRTHSSLSFRGLNQLPSTKSRGLVTCTLQPRAKANPKLVLDAQILSSICSDMPAVSLNTQGWSHIANLKLADPYFYRKQPIDLLIGAEAFPQILLSNVIPGKGDKEPAAIDTIFGYVLMGKINTTTSVTESSCLFVETELEDIVKRFWELEQIPPPTMTVNNDQCEQHFVSSYSRNREGRYIVSLPFKEGYPPTFGDSHSIALKCLKSLEYRLKKKPDVYASYQEAIHDYLESGHMTLAPSISNPEQVYYIPHHAVFKPDSTSTKLRVVFNASCKSSNGKSLNDTLLAGPKLQTDITKILLHFRLHKFVLIADIKQMYRQILVNPEHCDFQRLLWRFNPDQPVQEYVMNRVTFGVSAAPYLALRTLKQLALDESLDFPQASQVLQSDIYVDDVITGGNSIEETNCLALNLISLLKRGGFDLKKFASNEPDVLNSLPLSAQQSISFDKEEPSFVKVLGLQWNPASDCFSYNICPGSDYCTKRTILSELARIFDPLGFLSPLVVFAKHLIQRLWMLGIDWDQQPPLEIVTLWRTYQSELHLLSNIALPRFLSLDESTVCEIHGFCDSSEIAFAAVVYFRLIRSNGHTSTILICSKSRVAPLKKLSIPRLELSSALLLAELISFVRKVFEPKIKFSKVMAWSDSQIVLSWINSPSYKWQTFVANRVALIQDQLPGNHWNHVASIDNPADCASRGLLPSQLLNHPLWWAGPDWLNHSSNDWPMQPDLCHTVEEVKNQRMCLAVTVDNDLLSFIEKFSSLSKLQRSFSYCLRFVSYSQGNKVFTGAFTTKELHQSLLVLVRLVQQAEFCSDMKQITQGKLCSKPLRKLNPFVDSENILRVGGRLRNSSLGYDSKHPILLPRSSSLTRLIISHFHRIYLHPGQNTLLALLRRQFWILSPHRAIKSVLADCHTCFRVNPTSRFPIMGDLPQSRLSEVKAFKFVGVDFAGAFAVTMNRVRGAKVLKAYLCLFVCFTTKAVHLELASDLSTEAFLAAFRRFLSRRGQCVRIHSDCGTNFVGANRALMHCMQSVVESEGFKWHFNPPSSPHMGGLWESQIKVVKRHLLKTIGEQILTFEELSTVFTQIEALLNSRPLCPSSSDPNDFTVITPSHFLNIEPLGSFIEEDFSDLKLSHLSRWQKIQALQQQFWRQWSLEYLNTLQQRNKWNDTSNPITPGKLVLIKNELTPPLQWKLGRIEKVYPGADNIVRVAQVRTAHGEMKRPIVKLCALPNQ